MAQNIVKQFGPNLFTALVLLLLDEINTLRQRAGLPQYTKGQLVTALKNKLNALPSDDWTKDA